MANRSLFGQLDKLKQSLAGKLGDASLIVEGEMHKLVAIKTGRLDSSIKAGQVVDRGAIISVDVGSEGVPYAIYVDQGVKGLVYDYHRGGKIVYSGFGQRFIERALQNTQARVREKLLEARF